MPGPQDLIYTVTPQPSTAFTWSDIANQVARWDANIPGSITEVPAVGVTQVADQVSTYDLDAVVVTETFPTYDASDPIFGNAGSIRHTAGVDSLRSQLPDTSQAFTVWGVMSPPANAGDLLWNAQASGPRLGMTYASVWDEGALSWEMSSDGTNFRNGSDGWAESAFLFIAYFNGASSYIEIDGFVVTLDGTTVGTTMITDLYLVAADQAWTILGVVSGEIDSTTRANMLTLARSERGVPAAWSPSYLAPHAWYRADLGHATSDGNPMSAWANQGIAAGAGDLQQGTGSLQPTYDAAHASFNNQAVVNFVSGGDVMYAAADTWWHLPTESSDASVVAIGSTASASGAEELLTTRAYSSVGGLRLAIRAAGACQCNFEESGGVATVADSGANGTQNAVTAVAGVLTGATTTTHDSAACWVNGASAGATTADLDAPVAASANREFCVGGTNTTTGALNGYIAEILFCKRLLTAAEDAALTSYFNTRYGLSLPGVTQ